MDTRINIYKSVLKLKGREACGEGESNSAGTFLFHKNLQYLYSPPGGN